MVPSVAAPGNSAAITPRDVSWVPVLVAGGTLSLFAFVGGELPGVAGVVILTLASTGFAWAPLTPSFWAGSSPPG